MKRLSLLALASLMTCILTAQTGVAPGSIASDSLLFKSLFSTSTAWDYVDQAVNTSTLWQSQEDPLRDALRRLLDHSIEPFDSVNSRLVKEDFSLVEVHTIDPPVSSSIELRWLNDSTFLVDPKGWSPNLYIKEEVRLIFPEDTAAIQDSIAILNIQALVPDTLRLTVIDTFAIESLGISMHTYGENQVRPSLDRDELKGVLSSDLSRVDYFKPGITWMASEDSPFMIVEGEHQLDSLQQAVNTLLEYNSERDSTILWVNDMYGKRTPFWLTRGDNEAYRFWVKNYNNDSITLWIGNPAQNEISLMIGG